jgi:hypothetical protein
MITEIGLKLNIDHQAGPQEHKIYQELKQQIAAKFANDHNLIVNLTWFGPQFSNGAYERLLALVNSGVKIDRLFWFCLIDPLTVRPEFLDTIEQQLQPIKTYRVGVAFPGQYTFHMHSIFVADEMPPYTETELLMRSPDHVFVAYNRKPKPHRIHLVEKIFAAGLDHLGIVTLGQNNADYDVAEGVKTDRFIKLAGDDPELYTPAGRSADQGFGGVPYDCATLGLLPIWQRHFLNVVSETEYRPWDTVFPTEKILKPIIGLRPFVINGQTTEYQWLRDQGFQTFNQYWPHVELEHIVETQVQDTIVAVLKYLAQLPPQELQAMYTDMLPALQHNRSRWFEFAEEQRDKVRVMFQ